MSVGYHGNGDVCQLIMESSQVVRPRHGLLWASWADAGYLHPPGGLFITL